MKKLLFGLAFLIGVGVSGATVTPIGTSTKTIQDRSTVQVGAKINLASGTISDVYLSTVNFNNGAKIYKDSGTGIIMPTHAASSGTVSDFNASTATFPNGAKIYKDAGTGLNLPTVTSSSGTITTFNSATANITTGIVSSGTVSDANVSTITFSNGAKIQKKNGGLEIPGTVSIGSTTVYGTVTSTSGFYGPLHGDGSNITGLSGVQLASTQTFTGANTFTSSLTATGYVSFNQASFLVRTGAIQTDVTGDGTGLVVAYDTEIFDTGSNFNTSTYEFTAPVTGHYFLSVSVRLDGFASGHTYCQLSLDTSNRSYAFVEPTGGITISRNLRTAVVADMDKGDTASVAIACSGAAKSVDVGDVAAQNHFSGYLLP